MGQANDADNRHLGAAEGGVVWGWNESLCQLDGTEVVSPAEEKGDRYEEYEEESRDGMGFHEGDWGGGGGGGVEEG